MSEEGQVLSPRERVERLEKIVADQGAEIAQLRAIISAIGAVFTGGGTGAADVADDDELDSKFGNEPIRKDPSAKYWTGQKYAGRRFSECEPEYLDAFGKWKSVCAKMKAKDAAKESSPAKRAEFEKYAGYDSRDAARARGWAQRLRSGWQPPEKPGLARSGGGLGLGGGTSLMREPSSLLRPAPAPTSASSPTTSGEEDHSGDSFNFGANKSGSVALDLDDDDDDLSVAGGM